jgi:fumarate hydratase, class II
VKKAAALVNKRLGHLRKEKADLIVKSADEVIAGKLDDNFPPYVWQTGSGTQSNINVNEVISNRSIQMVGGTIGSQEPVHPNDHVNMSQSSNDSFPTAMHIAAVKEIKESLLPKVRALQTELETKAKQWQKVVKIGRTHLEDAVPLTVGQEWSGYAMQVHNALQRVEASLAGLYQLAAGGEFGAEIAKEIAELTGYPFVTAQNKFEAQGSLDAIVAAHASLRGLAVALMKIANDMRWLASGPRCGIAELSLPENEPGSSIMPGKVNPTQCEAIVMICIQVIGNDTAVAFAGSQGNFELNAMRPIIINNFLHSARILADGCEKFLIYSVEGTQVNEKKIAEYLQNSLMLVTALSPVIGYDNASKIAHTANRDGSTLREAAIKTRLIDPETFDRVVNPQNMVGDTILSLPE